MANNDFVADRRVYLDKDGKVVEADDPNRLTLLVAEGASLPYDEALKHGLINEAGESVGAEEGEAEEGGESEEKKPAAKKATAKKATAKKK